jgi:2-amino-4-hydroxy-6-hydroxymethyldihydropteridine diphosphokinase
MEAYLGIGSNVGDRLRNLRRAVDALTEADGVVVSRVSSVYSTEPVGYTEQPEFLNAVIAVDTDLSPEDLLRLALRVEEEGGRERSVRWGPRAIDIDILIYGDLEIHRPYLEIPHPRLAERRFVLEPLAEVAPDLRLPDGRLVRGLADALTDSARVLKEPDLVISL